MLAKGRMFDMPDVNYIEKKCRKLIFTLSKSAEVTWRLKHKALKTIYTGGILPLILYGAPVWKRVLDNTCYKAKIIRIQRLINIRIAKAYHTVSNDALCVIMGIIPLNIKIEETAKYYKCIKGNGPDRSGNGSKTLDLSSELRQNY